MLTLLALTALLQAPVPLVTVEGAVATQGVTTPAAPASGEETQLRGFLGKKLLSYEVSNGVPGGFRLRQGARVYLLDDDLSGAMGLVPAALKLAVMGREKGLTASTLGIIGLTLPLVGLAGGLTCLAMLAVLPMAVAVQVAVVGLIVMGVALVVGIIALAVGAQLIEEARGHFSTAVAVYNRALLELPAAGAVSSATDLSAPPLLRF